MAKVTLNNQAIDMDVAVNLMDDGIREELHTQKNWESEQHFLDAYIEAHKVKYGERFEV
jgi:hypothetical protein